MATDLEQKPKHETFVENQLAKVGGRVRALDAGRAFMLFLIVTLGYALAMALTDRALELPAALRLGVFLAYVPAALFFLGWTGMCLIRRINPYYAARQLEQTLPDAKNSVVNWLDLKDKDLPPVIHGALGLRAARDLKKADPERAVASGWTWLLAGLLAALVLGLLILFFLGPKQFTSLMGRAFAPFEEGAIATRTSITMVEPEGDAVVRPGRPITFRAEINGRVPAVNQEGAPSLLWHYQSGEDFVRQAMEQDLDGTWYWTMPADLVINGGLFYKVTAGDAETPEFQIKVVTIPQVMQFDVDFAYRPYLRLPGGPYRCPKAAFKGLQVPQGTLVTLTIRTNCELREGKMNLQLEGNQPQDLPGDLLPDDPTALRFPKLLLDRSGLFFLHFVSKEKENNSDRSSYPIEVFPDNAPRVQIKKPGKDVELPANGTLSLEGVAGDDHGIKSMTLKNRIVKGPVLEPKPYRPGKSLQLVNGKYPDRLDYMDFVALDKLKTDKGEAFPLARGMVFEYWLEAVDNSDYPNKDGNVGRSQKYKVTILDPDKDQKKQQQQRQKAQQDQQQHQKKQDQDLAKQNEKAKQEQEAGKKENPQQNPEGKEKRDNLEKQAEDIAKKLKDQKDQKDQKEQQDQKEGQAKGADQKQGESKDGQSEMGSSQPQAKDGGKNNKKEEAGQQKDGGSKEGQDKSAQAKDGGENKSQQKNDPSGQAKDQGQENPQSGAKGTAKDSSADSGQKNGNDQKSVAKEQPQKGSGTAKDQGGSNNAGEKQGAAKDAGADKGSQQNAKAEDKAKGNNGPDSQAKSKASQSTGKEEPSAAKSDTKSVPKESSERATAKDKGKKTTEVSQAKGNESAQPKEPTGTAKGQDLPEQGTAKTGAGRDLSQAKNPQAKGPGPGAEKSPPPAASKKDGDPGNLKGAAQAKGNGSKKGNEDQKPFREPTADEIAKLAKDLNDANNRKEAEKALEAEKELRKIAQKSEKPEARDAAQDALNQANKGPSRAKGADGSDDKTAKSCKKEKGDTGNKGPGQGEAKSGTPQAKTGKGKGEGEGEGEPKEKIAEAKGGHKAGSFGAGSHGIVDEPKAQPINEQFSKKGGNLTLEDFHKLAEKAKKAMQNKEAGIDDAQLQKFVKDLRAYEEWLRRANSQAHQNKTNRAQGTGAGLLPSYRPKIFDSKTTSTVDPIDPSRPLPPPEFRDIQRLFTGSAAGGKKK